MELKQKRIWDKRHFKLLEDGVWMRVKTPTDDIEMKVKYEELGLEIIYVRNKTASLVLGVLIFLSTIVGRLLLKDADLEDPTDQVLVLLFSLVIFTLVLLSWSDSRKPLVVIHGGEKTIALLRNRPDTETVDRFIDELHDRIKSRIVKLRVRPEDDTFPFEYKISALESLKEENLIDDVKYQEILQQLNSNKSSIGF